MTELIVSIYYFASAGSFYTKSLSKITENERKHLKVKDFKIISIFPP